MIEKPHCIRGRPTGAACRSRQQGCELKHVSSVARGSCWRTTARTIPVAYLLRTTSRDGPAKMGQAVDASLLRQSFEESQQ